MSNYNAICPKCSNLICVDEKEEAAVCPKCKKAIIVETAARAYKEQASKYNAICPKCGALLNLDEGDDAALCPKCNKPIIVEKAIRAYEEQAVTYNAVCPKCGALLCVDTSEDAAVCPKCNKAFAVESAVNAYKGKKPPTEATKTVTEAPPASPLDDFKIKDGVLLNYIGKGGDVVIPDGVTEIAEDAFLQEVFSSVKSIYIPEGVVKVGKGAFSACEEIDVYIPRSLEKISNGAFSGEYPVGAFKVAEGNPRYRVIKDCLVDIKTKTLIAHSYYQTKIPSDPSIETIATGTYSGAHWLYSDNDELVIPNGITTVERDVFYAVECKRMIISESVTKIYLDWFFDCTEEIVFKNKDGWTYGGRPIDIPDLTSSKAVDDFCNMYSDYPLICRG